MQPTGMRNCELPGYIVTGMYTVHIVTTKYNEFITFLTCDPIGQYLYFICLFIYYSTKKFIKHMP